MGTIDFCLAKLEPLKDWQTVRLTYRQTEGQGRLAWLTVDKCGPKHPAGCFRRSSSAAQSSLLSGPTAGAASAPALLLLLQLPLAANVPPTLLSSTCQRWFFSVAADEIIIKGIYNFFHLVTFSLPLFPLFHRYPTHSSCCCSTSFSCGRLLLRVLRMIW